MQTPSGRTIRFNRRGFSVALAHYFILVLVLLAVLVCLLAGVPLRALIYPGSLALVLLFFWSLWSWQRATGSAFDSYSIFFVAAMLFNGGHAFLEVFGVTQHQPGSEPFTGRYGFQDFGLLFGIFSVETTVKTLLLIIISFLLFHLGGLSSAALERTEPKQTAPPPDMQAVRLIGWALILISIVPAVYVLRERLVIVLASGYTGLFDRQVETGVASAPAILAAFLVPGTFFLLAGSQGRRLEILVSAGLIGSFTMLDVLMGARQKIMPLAAYIWLWHRLVWPIPRGLLFGSGAAMLCVVFPLLRFTRETSGEDMTLDFVIQTFFSIDNPVVTILSDMGTTMVTVAYTIELVPSFRDFDWGAGYFYSLFSLVPSLFWRLNPAAAHAYSDWLIWFHSPYNAARGGGLGYSFIAEAYLNFGWVGGPIALGIMGLLYGRLTLWATRSNDPARLAMVATLLGFGLLFARGETGRHLVRPLAWYALFPYLGVFVLRRLRYELPWHLRRQRITRQE